MRSLTHFLLILFITAAFSDCTQKKEALPTPGFIKLGWKDLKGLDPASGKMSDAIKKADGQKVKIPGFITPLTDDAAQIFEFTLVPYPVSCVHSPPPPANQIVVVTLENQNIDPEDLWSPFWVYGTLHVEKTENEFFQASYTMKAQNIEHYE